jgi:hypothetical protein
MRVRPAACIGRGGKQACLLTASPGTNLLLSAPRAARVTISLRRTGSAAAGSASRALYVPAGAATFRPTGGFGFCHFPVPGHACTPTPGRYVLTARFQRGKRSVAVVRTSLVVLSSSGRDLPFP